jgi:predicted SnoaL-like aldol condensation-catalyzing enzyme
MDEDSKEHPNKIMDIKMILEEGNLITTYSHIKQSPDALGFAAVHIFRIENNLIEEMWDVVHVISEDSPNKHGMF